jgi:protocadherin Fat 4
MAADGGGLSNTLTLNLALTDVNDHTPQFSANTFTAPLNENAAASTSVTTITATDNDLGPNNGVIVYSVTGRSFRH